MAEVPPWRLVGDWFDVCKCAIPCPCTFAQAPTYGDCDGVMAWHIREGRYGDVSLDGLNLVSVSYFVGNVWAGESKVTLGIYLDERADEAQRAALQTIFGGHAGGWPGQFAAVFGEVRGIEPAPISFEIADNLAYWRVEVPGRVTAAGEALAGPTTLPGQRVQVLNPPGCETGPNGVATWGMATTNRVDAYGFRWDWAGRSSKHIPFDWSGPE